MKQAHAIASRPSRLRKRLYWGSAAVIAIAAIVLPLALSQSAHADQPPSPTPVPPVPKVTVATVEQRFITEYEERSGHVEAIETVELPARVSSTPGTVTHSGLFLTPVFYVVLEKLGLRKAAPAIHTQNEPITTTT